MKISVEWYITTFLKSKHRQTAAFENGNEPAKIFPDLRGVVSKRLINLRIKGIGSTIYIEVIRASAYSSNEG